MNKKITTAILLLTISVSLNAQLINRPAFNKNIQYLPKFCLNNYKGELKEYTDNYIVKIVFNIDTSGNVINCRAVDTVVVVPDSVEKYAVKQILKTNGHWFPEIRNNKLVVSADITFFFWISTKPREPVAEHLDDIKEWKVFSPNNYTINVDNMYGMNQYSFWLELPRVIKTQGMIF